MRPFRILALTFTAQSSFHMEDIWTNIAKRCCCCSFSV